MVIKIIELDIIESTQDYLKNLLTSQSNSSQILIIASKQTAGIGRHGNQWDFIDGSIACSFTLTPNKVLTLTSLEIAVLVNQFIKQELSLDIQLKWPNDLFFQEKKCGGIIMHNDGKNLIVGLGINNTPQGFNQSKWRTGINLPPSIAKDLVTYIYNNRIKNSEQLINLWQQSSIHMNQNVSIDNDKGIFIGVGNNGEALLETSEGIKKYFSGSLRFIL